MNAINYHLQTRHFPNRFAKSPQYLDWANQPSPYKTYINAKKIPLTPIKLTKSYEKLYLKNEKETINLNTIATLLKNSAAINAQKIYGNASWYVRVNPSSGNLHPEEIYVIHNQKVYHFNSKDFTLELLGTTKTTATLIILTSIPLRESWKYGERALRYCLLDTGHLIAALRFSANLLGWKFEFINKDLSDIIGLNKAKFFKNEDEIFEAAFLIEDGEIVKESNLTLEYLPLTKDSIRWDIIYEVEFKNINFTPKFSNQPLNLTPSPFSALEIIQNRRSALGFKQEYIKKSDFLDILDKTIRRKLPPFDSGAILGEVELIVFVNRVDGLKSGIYKFKEKLELIEEGDFSNIIGFINCTQDIARDSAFVVMMVIKKDKIISNFHYKLAMFEAGIIGYVLYLEAEAKGIRGCGIGCFFDEGVNEVIDSDYLVLYGFSVGIPKIDERVVPLGLVTL